MATIGLALGAGGARGLAHIHALEAFDELGLKPAVIAGTSMGALIGAAYCAGMSGREIREWVIGTVNDRFRLIGDVFKVRPNSVKSFLADGGPRIGEFNLEAILTVFLPRTIPETFEALTIPLRVVTTDYHACASAVFDTGPLRLPLAASAAMPAVFLPVKIGNRYHIDGSSTDPCPLGQIQGRADHAIAVDVSGGPGGEPGIKPGKIDAMYAASQMMQATIARAQAAAFPKTVLLRPPVADYRPLDFLKAAEILEKTASLGEQVKRAIAGLCEQDSD